MLVTDITTRTWATQTLPSPQERRRLRKAAGLTLDEVARRLGVTRVSASRYERSREAGGREPRGQVLIDYWQLLAEIQIALEVIA